MTLSECRQGGVGSKMCGQDGKGHGEVKGNSSPDIQGGAASELVCELILGSDVLFGWIESVMIAGAPWRPCV